MGRFYLNIWYGDKIIADEEGLDVPDDAARREYRHQSAADTTAAPPLFVD
jgi:hypothetical protein